VQNEFTNLNNCEFIGDEQHPDLCKVPEMRNADLGVYWYLLIIFGEALLVKMIAYFIFRAKMNKYVN